MKGSLQKFLDLLHYVILQLLLFKNQKLIFAWFVHIHTTLSKWLSTLGLYMYVYSMCCICLALQYVGLKPHQYLKYTHQKI